MKAYSLFTAVFLLISAFFSHAQNTDPSQEKSAKVKFAYLQGRDESSLHLVHSKGSLPIQVSSLNLSPSYKIPLNTPIHICTAVPEELTPTALKSVSIAKFTLRQAHQEAFILLGKNPDSKNLTPIIIKANDSDFKWGSRLIFNFSNKPVAIQYGDAKIVIQPNKKAFIRSKAGKNGAFIPVRGLYKDGQSQRRFLSSRWVHDDKSRSLVFIYDTPNSKSPSFHGIDDTNVPEPRNKQKVQ